MSPCGPLTGASFKAERDIEELQINSTVVCVMSPVSHHAELFYGCCSSSFASDRPEKSIKDFVCEVTPVILELVYNLKIEGRR